MTHSDLFQMRISPADRESLAALAAIMNRSQADTIRFCIREMARALAVAQAATPTAHVLPSPVESTQTADLAPAVMG